MGALAACLAAGVILWDLGGATASSTLVALLGLVALSLALAPGRSRPLMLAAAVALAGAARAAAQDLALAEARSPQRMAAGVTVDDREAEVLAGVVSGPVSAVARGQRFVLRSATSAAVVVTAPEEPRVLPGDRVAVQGYLRTPRGYRVPGATDMAELARSQGGELTMRARELVVVEPDAEWSPWRLATRVHWAASARIAGRGGHTAGNAAARAMVTGDRSGLYAQREVSEHVRVAGVAHVLSVSGMHLAVVALLAFALARRLWAAVPALAMRMTPAAAAALVAAPVAVGFTMMSGAQTATLRALLAVLAVLAGAAMARRCRLVDALGLAAVILILQRPSVLAEPGFQLSFAATASLALAPGSKNTNAYGWAGRIIEAAWRLLATSVLCTLATAPFTALHFGQVAPGGLVANMIVVPLAELCVLPLGLFGVVVAALWPAAGGVLIDIAVAASGLVADVAAVVAEHGIVLAAYPPGRAELVGMALIAAAWAGVARARWPRRLAGMVAVLGAGIVFGSYVISTYLAPAWRQDVRITFLDVGQGDAAVIELPGGGAWLIDGGGLPFVIPVDAQDEAARRQQASIPGAMSVARFLAARRIGRIDRLILSHPHPDHFEGVRALIGHVDITEIWAAGDYEKVSPSYAELLQELAAAGTRIVYPVLDQPIEHGPVRLTALAPRYLTEQAIADPVSSINDNSLVVRVEMAGRAVLFTGDLEAEGEELLVERYGSAVRADVVKVPHHGSRTSSTALFTAAVAPAWAVISCGVANRFGFPAPEVEERWRSVGAAILRTDQVGAITVSIRPDGHMQVDTFDIWPRPDM